MLDLAHLLPSQYEVQPWKNGGGTTRQIAVDGQSPYRWRVSWATVSGTTTFSPFPGYDRSLVLVSGGPLELAVESKRPRRLSTFQVFAFSGDVEVGATAEHPAEDFNVFALHGKAKASVFAAPLRQSEDLQFPFSGQEHFLFCAYGEAEIYEQNSDKKMMLKAGETLRVSRKSKKEFLNLRARGHSTQTACVWVVVHLL